MNYEIGKLNLGQAEEVGVLLAKKGIKKTANEILASRCLEATDENGGIMALAEATGQDKATVYYFEELSKKKKKRIKASFFSIIFRKQTWESDGPIKACGETEIVENHDGYMFPGG